jgi:hypothetical protein
MDFEWVAQVSLLKPGFLLAKGVLAGTPRSQKQTLGHPLNFRPRSFHH